MKKLTLSLSLIVIYVIYVIFGPQKMVTKDDSVLSVSDTLKPDLGSQALSKYKDGVYQGSIEDVFYGNVEVEATIAGGALANVKFLQYPDNRDNSIKINNRAMPILKSEAIKNQTGDVDIVSGATQTSKGFIKSLGNALVQAEK